MRDVRLRRRPAADWLDGSAALSALLVLLMVLPAAFVIWFMNEAIATRTAEAKRSVRDAYRGQLRLVQARIDAHWQARAAALQSGGEPASSFARQVLERGADGLVVLDPEGTPVYPADGGASHRPLVAELERQIRAHDIEGAAETLNDYSTPLAARDRLAFMDRLRKIAPDISIPTQAALRVSLAWIRAGAVVPETGGFHETAFPRLWALASEDRRVVALYWTSQLESAMHDFLHEVEPEGIRFIAFPPGVPPDEEAIAAGMWMPGWQLSYVPLDPGQFDDGARQQVLRYVWIGLAGIALIAAVGATAGRAFLQQMRLARLKTDLAAAVSHELRTPLASIRVLVDGLLADEHLDPRKTREYLTLVATENERLHRLIENFLTFSRLERTRYQFAFAAAHPSEIVAGAVAAIRDRVPPSCDLRVDVAPDLPPLIVDADALGTALLNLLDNALKYTPAEKRIHLRVCRDDEGFVAFAVEDNGIGIPPREHQRIFKRFYRVDQRLTRETGGVGLGLSIVELIVRAHHGTVSVRSTAGSGSTFTMRLPCPQGAVA
jgi:signal transduction histidine kinase